MDVGFGVRANAARTPAKPAVVLGQRVLSYGQVGERMARVANAALGSGLAPGQNAAIVAGNVVEYFEIVCGISWTGAAIATVNPRQTPRELAAILNDCDARLIFVDPANVEALRSADLPDGAGVIVLGDDYDGWIGRAASTPLDRVPAEWDTFAIPYTSGTTGTPKGVCLSHRSRVMGFLVHASVYGCFSPDDRFLVTTPLFHGGGFAFPMGTLFLGGTVDLMPPFAPDLLAAELATGRATGTFVVPTQLNAMLGLGLDRIPGHRLKAAICNAAPLAEETKLGTLDLLGEGVLHETYGSTEGGVITNLAPADMRLKARCVGPPIAGQSVRLLDEAGGEVPTGEIGELFSNGPTLFNGYHNKPEETAAGFRDGWFSAGDLARMDEDGYFYVVDRRKDMIISGGVNIYPREIEEILYGLPGIREAAVVGQPDAHWGEAVCAFIVPEAGAVPDKAAIIGRCREVLARHKVPKALHVIDAVPRNAAGKVLKKDLRARLE